MVRREIVLTLLWLCELTHWVTRHMPVRSCLIASWSDQLDQRWGTGVWKQPTP